jgi:hypothetical protein
MAKRTTPRSEANDAAAASSPRARSRRTPANTSPEADTIAAYPGVERSENDVAAVPPIQNPAMGSNNGGQPPSEDEIRQRAYQRYLERGSHQGSPFDDWVEAERDLRTRR